MTAIMTNSASQKRSDVYTRRKAFRPINMSKRSCQSYSSWSAFAHLYKTLYISAMEARRNVKMVLFERRDSNLKDYIEYIGMRGCLRLTEAVQNV